MRKDPLKIELLLHNFSDLLSDRRVLYLSFDMEMNYPLVAMTKSIGLIRQELINKVVPGLPINGDEREQAKKMAEACRLFNDKTMKLRGKILEDRPLYEQESIIINTIKDALMKFRQNFIHPMFWLLTQFNVSIPDGILRNWENLQLVIPSVIYVRSIPVRSDKSIHYAGNSDSGYYLRICTIAQDMMFNHILFPINSELFFYDPHEVANGNKIWKATLGRDCIIKEKQWTSGDQIYFDKIGELHLFDPTEKEF